MVSIVDLSDPKMLTLVRDSEQARVILPDLLDKLTQDIEYFVDILLRVAAAVLKVKNGYQHWEHVIRWVMGADTAEMMDRRMVPVFMALQTLRNGLGQCHDQAWILGGELLQCFFQRFGRGPQAMQTLTAQQVQLVCTVMENSPLTNTLRYMESLERATIPQAA